MTARFFPLKALTLLLALLVPGLLHAQDARIWFGQAHNVTVGVRSEVELTILRRADGTHAMSGQFDNRTLAGTVTGTGRPPLLADGQPACAQGHECLLFTGTITLGSDVGFPDGTTSSFLLTLDIDTGSEQATGVYHIGPLPGFDFDQYGILTLGPLTS